MRTSTPGKIRRSVKRRGIVASFRFVSDSPVGISCAPMIFIPCHMQAHAESQCCRRQRRAFETPLEPDVEGARLREKCNRICMCGATPLTAPGPWQPAPSSSSTLNRSRPDLDPTQGPLRPSLHCQAAQHSRLQPSDHVTGHHTLSQRYLALSRPLTLPPRSRKLQMQPLRSPRRPLWIHGASPLDRSRADCLYFCHALPCRFHLRGPGRCSSGGSSISAAAGRCPPTRSGSQTSRGRTYVDRRARRECRSPDRRALRRPKL